MKILKKQKQGRARAGSRDASKISNQESSRKQKRKTLRKQKKIRIKAYHQKHQHHQINIKKSEQSKKNTQKHKNPQNTQNNINKGQGVKYLKDNRIKTQKANNKATKTKKANQIDQKILQDEQQIEFYEKKLGMKADGKKYKNIMKGMGFDDDLFDFLQDISKKVNSSKDKYKPEMEQQSQQYEQQQDEQNIQEQQNDLNQNSASQQQNEFQNGDQEQLDQLNQQQDQDQNYQEDFQHQQLPQQHYQEGYWPQGFEPFDQQNQNIEEMIPKKKIDKKLKITDKPQTIQVKAQVQKKDARKKLFETSNKQEAEKMQIRKLFTSLFNKLSDGNIMITFRQMRQIFSNHSASATIPVFIQLYLKFNVEVQKPHLHILLSNIVLSAGLHQLLGNRLMAPLVSQIIDKFCQLQKEPEDQEQVQEIGYSKIFQRSKNCVIILSYLYEFGSLTADFILSFVQQLSKQLSKNHIQFLYLIIQKIGSKIRQNDPATLKHIIDVLKISITNFKMHQQNSISQQITKKIDIIEIQLNQLRFNRKTATFNDQRMAFFTTFISKNIPVQISSEKNILLLTYQQIKAALKSTTNWWDNIGGNSSKNQGGNQNFEMENYQVDSDKKELLALAKSLHLVTQIRKNIFLQIMQSQDYVQASQRVLSLKIKNMQQVATVLVQVCILQPTFNPFYPLVAAKIANIIHKFRLNIQYAVWDHIKLVDQYDLRKTSNLAKFCSRFVSNPLSNGSLSILKTFSDLINVSPSTSLFLKVFFTQFFKIVKKQYLAQLCQKLQEQNNRSVKQSIQQYLGEVGLRQKAFGFQQKMKILRKLLSIQKQME